MMPETSLTLLGIPPSFSFRRKPPASLQRNWKTLPSPHLAFMPHLSLLIWLLLNLGSYLKNYINAALSHGRPSSMFYLHSRSLFWRSSTVDTLGYPLDSFLNCSFHVIPTQTSSGTHTIVLIVWMVQRKAATHNDEDLPSLLQAK